MATTALNAKHPITNQSGEEKEKSHRIRKAGIGWRENTKPIRF